MTDIRIEYELLRELADRLDWIADEYDATDRLSDDAADAVGHDGLASKLRQSADGWRSNRGLHADYARGLGTMIDDIADQFESLDRTIGREP